MWSSMIIASELSDSELMTESCPTPPSLAISEHSLVEGTPQHIRDWLISCQVDSLVNPSLSLESAKVQTTSATCGPQQSNVYALLDQDTASLKTFQACLIADILGESSLTWPRAGIACDGVVYQLPSWEHRIDEIASGLWPTPRANKIGGYSSARFRPTLEQAVNTWPTPAAQMAKHGAPTEWEIENKVKTGNIHGHLHLAVFQRTWPTPRQFMHKDSTTDRGKGNLGEVVGGKLNPTWVEWLIGWPLMWTDLKPLAMGRFQSWLQQHGIC